MIYTTGLTCPGNLIDLIFKAMDPGNTGNVHSYILMYTYVHFCIYVLIHTYARTYIC